MAKTRNNKARVPASEPKLVALKPSSRMERLLRTGLCAAAASVQTAGDPQLRADVQAALNSGQGVGKRMERVWASVQEAKVRAFWSPLTQRLLGIRIVPCTCPPHTGHNA